MVSKASAFEGRLFLPGDREWERARIGRQFNTRYPDRQPAAILEASCVGDVTTGIRMAAHENWQVSVRSGGHSTPAWGIRDGALLIDLGALNHISYDTSTGIVVAGPAVQGRQLLTHLAEYGRWFAVGDYASVAIGGYLLQGGLSLNARGWGWGAEHVVAIDVVTATGELLHANAVQNEDLYWAARGAGPGFPGVVVAYHLRTRAAEPVLVDSMEFYPIELFDEVMTWLHNTHRSVSTDVKISALTITPPVDLPGHPGGPVLVVSALAFGQSRQAGDEALAPMWGCPVADRAYARLVEEHSSLDFHWALQEMAGPANARYTVQNAWLEGTAEELIPAMRSTFLDLPTPQSFASWVSMAPLRALPDMALSLQSEVYVEVLLISDDPEDDERLRLWIHDRFSDLDTVTVGQYVGDGDLAEREVRIFGDEQFARLQEIRSFRDPHSLFVGYLASGPEPSNVNHWIQLESNPR